MIQNRANEGAYIKDIAAELGVSSKTVSRALRRGSAPTGKPGRPRKSKLAPGVIRSLKQIIAWRGKPLAIRCDNGPEYLSSAITEWARRWGIRLEYIQPGKPQQNAYVERFNRTVRYEWLSQYHWEDLDQVQRAATEWMWSYNHERPNMALGGITPKQRLAMAA